MNKLIRQIEENLKRIELRSKEMHYEYLNIIAARQIQTMQIPDVCHTCRACNRVWVDTLLNINCEVCGSHDVKIEVDSQSEAA